MSKILIVGHHNSNYKKLEEILNFCGMAKASPSKIYKMTPQDINSKLSSVAISIPQDVPLDRQSKSSTNRLSKNQKSLALRHVQQLEGGYVQKRPKKMWDSLAFDLIVANEEQSFWGWSDSNAVNLLDYWADFDDEMVFILTYDMPDIILKYLLNDIEAQEVNQSIVDDKIKDWYECNQAMLNFYQKNKNRCLLVNGQQVLISPREYVRSVAKIAQIEPLPSNSELSALQDDAPLPNSLTLDFLIGEVLASSDDAHQMFGELQKLADLPFVGRAVTGSVLDLLKETADKQKKLLKIDVEKLYQARTDLEKSFLENKKLSDLLHQEREKIKNLEGLLVNKKETLNIDLLSSQIMQENDLLIKQLYKAQEELESYYIENQKLKSQNYEPSKPLYYGAVDRVKEDLPYRLGATMVNHSKSAKALAKLPLALTKEYLHFKRNNPTGLPALEEYQDFQEVEKVKRHLSYRLGEALVDGLKSPKKILELPSKMGKEILDFKSQK